MKVTVVKPFGYCNGVKRAIDLSIKTKKDNADLPVYIYGNLVHNAHVRDVLTAMGIVTLERDVDLDSLAKGIIITTAHGISEQIKDLIIKSGFIHIDATCPLVYKSFAAIKKAIAQNKYVLYFGSKNHPEATAALAINSKKVMIFENLDDLKKLDINKDYVLTNQTTIRHEELEKYFIYLINLKYKVDLMDEICNATKIRQTALRKALEDYYDLVLIIGDKTSNNSRQLFNLSLELNPSTHFIDSYLEINKEWLRNVESVLVCSGASTPNILVEQVVHFLENKSIENFEINNKKIIQG